MKIYNLRLENSASKTRLVMDITSNNKRTDSESTIWIEVDSVYKKHLATDVYDLCLFLPVCIAMYYNEDLQLTGCVSKTLYKNVVDYIIPALAGFSDSLHPIKVTVDGFKECNGEHNLIGTGISCGIDSLSTIYDRLILENEPEYRINSLFSFNCGWHGSFGDEATEKLFYERCMISKKVADELECEFIAVNSNFHAFLPTLGDRVSYFGLYSCVFALEKGLSRYYLASSYSYNQIMEYGNSSKNMDWSEYGDALAIPLMRTKTCELVSDGCQYTRSEKTERIADWDIAKKYLNVCCINEGICNCSICHKCIRTLLPLDALGKLDEYKKIFYIEKYKKIAYSEKCRIVLAEGRNAFATDNLNFCRKHGMELPSYASAFIYRFPTRVIEKIRYEKKKLLHK